MNKKLKKLLKQFVLCKPCLEFQLFCSKGIIVVLAGVLFTPLFKPDEPMLSGWMILLGITGLIITFIASLFFSGMLGKIEQNKKK